MFRILSKESNIFSIPVYMAFLLLILILLNLINFNYLELKLTSAIVTFLEISLGYFLFNTIALNRHEHLPIFLYTIFVICFYSGTLNLELAFTLLVNYLLLLILTNRNDYLRKSAFVLVGAILALNYLIFPYSWPMTIFVIFHIIGNSGRIGLNIFRLIFGALLIVMSYFGLMYFLNYTKWDNYYFPFSLDFRFLNSFYPLFILIPIILMLIYSVLDHFIHYSDKSPISRYKYTFILIFSLAQLMTIFFYMKNDYEFLLLLALPSSIILSRMLRFLPKYWMQECSLWLIIFTLIVFKLANYF